MGLSSEANDEESLYWANPQATNSWLSMKLGKRAPRDGILDSADLGTCTFQPPPFSFLPVPALALLWDQVTCFKILLYSPTPSPSSAIGNRISQPQHYWHFRTDKFLSGERGTVHCGMFSTISGFYILDASRTLLPVVTIKNVSRHCSMSPGWGQYRITPSLRTTGLEMAPEEK